MTSKRDYYEILEIKKNASLNEIKSAYREAALRHHPDRVPENQKKEAEEKFKEISEAYAVLSDSQKRQLYDQYGHAGIDQRFTHEDIFKGADFSGIFEELRDSGFGGDIFEGLFGDSGFDIFGRSSRGRSRRKGRDLELGVDITLEEAASGIERTINLPRYEPCTTCQGTGAKPGTKKSTCPQCKGSGQMIMSTGFFQLTQTCNRCRGQGSIIATPCPSCHGQGMSKVTRKIKVKIPRGVDTGSHLRIRGEGEVGVAGQGDLYVLINVKPHAIFSRHNNDITYKLNISVVKAILGGEVKVPTLNGKVKMKIPAGTQPNRIFRLRDKGVSDLHGWGRGDLLVKVNVEIPTNLTREEKRLIEGFARASNEDSL